MTLVIVNQAEEFWLDLITAVNMKLKLYKTNVIFGLTTAQQRALTESSFTEATFTGYTEKSLTGGSWTTTPGDPSTAVFAQQTFTSSADQAAQNIYGYYLVRSSDNKLEYFEQFNAPVIVQFNNDFMKVTPRITLRDTGAAS